MGEAKDPVAKIDAPLEDGDVIIDAFGNRFVIKKTEPSVYDLAIEKRMCEMDWVEINLLYSDDDNIDDIEDTFEKRELNKPGTLIDTDKGIFLIGHINPLRGVCDDCTKFDPETIVRRYKVIWNEND